MLYLLKPKCHLGFNDQFLPSSDRFASSNLLCMRQIFLLQTHARLRVPLRWKVSYSDNGFLSTQVISYVKIFSKWMLFASNNVRPGIGLWLFGKSHVYLGCDKIWKTCHQPLSEVIEVHNMSQVHSSSTELGFVYPCLHNVVPDYVLFWQRTANLCINYICLNQV